MKNTSTFALAISLTVTGALVAAPADAQRRKKDAATAPQVDPNARKYSFSKAARPLIGALQTVVTAKDAAGYPAALAAAQAAATTPDDKYAVAQLQLRQALDTQSLPAQATALEALIRSGGATQAELPKLYQNLGVLAYNAQDFERAGFAFEKLVELNPNDGDALINLAELRNRQGRKPEGIQLLERAIAARVAAGQPVSENWYKRAVGLSSDAKLAPQAMKLTRDWLTAFPTDQNWRDALSNYRYMVTLERDAELDRLRLMRATKALHGERSYGEYAETAMLAGLPGEAKAVLDEGVAQRVVDSKKLAYRDLLSRASADAAKDRPTLSVSETKAGASATGKLSQSTADAYLSYGDYAKAVTLYRAALTKGGVDANLVNTRLGIALAMTGDKAGATTAFSAVTGQRQDLARYWLVWLSKRA